MQLKWLIVSILSVLLVGCGTEQSDDGTLQVVATTTMLADLVEQIGGQAVTVHGLMGPGVDPHLYQASAGDVALMEQADVVIYNGLHLEGKMAEVFEQLDGCTVLCAQAALPQEKLISHQAGTYDPHVWFDVSLWREVAVYLAEQLAEIDGERAVVYQENLEGYLQALEDLEQYVQTRVSQLEEGRKILITAHDAFSYFGKAYGFTVIGLQGVSTDTEAGTADVRALADLIVEQQVNAIFVETSVPIKSMEALQAAVRAQGFDVSIGGQLYSDSLGDGQHDTYIAMVKSNVDTIVGGLMG